MHNNKLIRGFFISAGLLLLLTAISKIISSFGTDEVLNKIDPLFKWSFRSVFLVAGIIEFVAALFCLISKNVILRAVMIAWLSMIFLLYRASIVWMGYQKPCPCFGKLTGAIHISPETADIVIKTILAYLLTGSFATLFWIWRKRKNALLFLGD